MKKLVTLIILFALASCSTKSGKTNVEFDDLKSELENKSVDEIKNEINENIVMFERFIKMFDNPMFKDEIKNIETKDERYDEAFKIDTTNIQKALNQFNQISFEQSFKNNKTELKFLFPGRFNDAVELGTGVQEFYIPQKIYYTNGTVKKDSIGNYMVDTSFSRVWGKPIPIDSAEIKYELAYITKYDSIVLSKDNPKVNYAGGTIKIEKLKDNYIYLTKSDTIQKVLKYQARNKEGKVLDNKSSFGGGLAPEEYKKAIREMVSAFKSLQKKLNNNDFKNTDEIEKYVENEFSKLAYFNNSSNLYHKELYYHGNIESITLFFKKDVEKLETSFTAKNLSKFGALINMEIEDGTAFINQQGEEQFRVKGEYEAINSRFYEDYDYFYHLNFEKKKMDTLFVFDVALVNTNTVAIKAERKSDLYTLFNLDYKQTTKMKFNEVYPQKNITLATTSDDKLYRIDDSGKEHVIKEFNLFDEEQDNMIRIQNKKRQNGFMTTFGKIVIPIQYSYAYNFNEGLAMVANQEDKYGFINKKGTVIIPFIYKRHFSHEQFKDGKIIVKTQDNKTITIDKNGNVLDN